MFSIDNTQKICYYYNTNFEKENTNMMLYDIYQEKCHELIEKLKVANTDEEHIQTEFDLADLKVNYYLQFEKSYPENSRYDKFYKDQLRHALFERADVIDKMYDIGMIEILDTKH